jgi:hypothetical protein
MVLVNWRIRATRIRRMSQLDSRPYHRFSIEMGEKGLQTFDQGLLCTELRTHIDRYEVTRREKRV